MVDRDAIRAEIKQLLKDGNLLYRRELIATASAEDRKKLADMMAKDPNRDKLLKKPDFGCEYQSWYSKALRVVEQLLPDRYNEFRALYKDERRKTLDIETYGIADYIGNYAPVSFRQGASAERALNCFRRQIDIVSTAEIRLDSFLADLGRALHSELLDEELVDARKLLADGNIRAAGVVAGVALEAHLKKLISDHSVSFRKKAMLSNLNEALKDANVYDVPQWRRIQHLTDVRNLCGHKGEREPKHEEVEDLITETTKIVKTLF
ncbi:MAG TPA: hypothetical protein VIJ38_17815 [Acidobacteriaceae bacterium]